LRTVLNWSPSDIIASSVPETYSICLSKETKFFTPFSGETVRRLQIRAVSDQLHGAKLKTIYCMAKPPNPFVKEEKYLNVQWRTDQSRSAHTGSNTKFYNK
jgi:hypothetical protein